MCLAVTCQLHFKQNDLNLFRATAVTRGWNEYQNKSQHGKLPLEKKILAAPGGDLNPRPFDHESGALRAELPPLQESEPRNCVKAEVAVMGFLSLISLMVSVDVKQLLKEKGGDQSSCAV